MFERGDPHSQMRQYLNVGKSIVYYKVFGAWGLKSVLFYDVFGAWGLKRVVFYEVSAAWGNQKAHKQSSDTINPISNCHL